MCDLQSRGWGTGAGSFFCGIAPGAGPLQGFEVAAYLLRARLAHAHL